MTTLSRDASAARLLLDLTIVSVKEPTRDRCVRPPSHQRANLFNDDVLTLCLVMVC